MPRCEIRTQVVEVGDSDRKVQIIECIGELDLDDLAVVNRCVEAGLKRGCRHQILDATLLTYIASAALGTIAKTVKRLRRQNGDLSLAKVPPNIRRIIGGLGLDKVIRCHASVSGALEACK